MEDRADGNGPPQKVAVVIAARNDRRTISATVRACRAIPGVDLIVVVDDASDDETAQAARSAGAVVVRHSMPRGRASALETGVKVAAMRDRADWPPRHLLFLDPDLGDSAVGATPLVEAVVSGEADCAIGFSVSEAEALRERRKARNVRQGATKLVQTRTGWQPKDVMAHEKCLTRDAVDAVMPFASGATLDVAMTIDLLERGFTVVEIPCDFEHSGAESEDGTQVAPNSRFGKTNFLLPVQMRWQTRRWRPGRVRPDAGSAEAAEAE